MDLGDRPRRRRHDGHGDPAHDDRGPARQLGGIPARRVLLKPTPGTATERDLIEIHGHTNRPYELVDGTLVEKAMGYDEARLGFLLASYLQDSWSVTIWARSWAMAH